MKKLLFSLVIIAFISMNINAQKINTEGLELGVRIGGYGDAGAAVDVTFPMWGNRIHGDVGFYSNAIGIAAFYDWSFPIAEGFSFYPGVGADMTIGDVFVLGIGGELGFEYAFKIPLTIGMDWRPTIRLVDANGFGSDSFGLNIRYRF